MAWNMHETIYELNYYRSLLAVSLPLLGGALVVASSVLVPRGQARAFLTGAWMLATSIGAAFLLLALVAIATGEPLHAALPLLVPGLTLSLIMGIFSPQVIRSYQHLAARVPEA